MKRFEVGKSYGAADTAAPHITILRRTDKTVWVKNDCIEWKMRVKVYGDSEYCTDSSVPVSWQECYSYYAKFED